VLISGRLDIPKMKRATFSSIRRETGRLRMDRPLNYMFDVLSDHIVFTHAKFEDGGDVDWLTPETEYTARNCRGICS